MSVPEFASSFIWDKFLTFLWFLTHKVVSPYSKRRCFDLKVLSSFLEVLESDPEGLTMKHTSRQWKENQKFNNLLRRLGEHIYFEGLWNYWGWADLAWRFWAAKVNRGRCWDIFIHYSHNDCYVLSRNGRECTFICQKNISWRYLIELPFINGKNNGCAQYNGCESDQLEFKSLICQLLDITVRKDNMLPVSEPPFPQPPNWEDAYLLCWVAVMCLMKLVHLKCLAQCVMEKPNTPYLVHLNLTIILKAVI